MTTGEKIRDIRKKKHMSQEQLAVRCGLSQSAISAIEKGTNSPTISSLQIIADGLRVPLVDLTGDHTPPIMRENSAIFCETPDEERLIMLFRSLNHETQQSILKNVEGLAGNPNLQEKPTRKKEIS